MLKGKSYQFGYLEKADVGMVYSIVQESARVGRNVGINEYPDLTSFTGSLDLSEGFSIKQDTGELGTSNPVEGGVFVQPCLLTRSTATCVAHVHVFLSDALYREGLYLEVVNQGLRFAKDLQLRYSTALIWVFQVCWFFL